MRRALVSASLVLGFSVGFAQAGAHTWDVNEVFSNFDGTIQFIELREANGTPGEIFLAGLSITADMTGRSFTIPSNLVGPSSNRHLLFATASFAALPGAPTPDYIIPPGSIPFFALSGDTVRYHVYDAFTFGPVPIDGVMSMNQGGIVAANSPTNYAGQTGSVDAGGPGGLPGDMNCDGLVTPGDIAGFVLALTNPTEYENQFPDCDILNGDVNGDLLVTPGDIAGFVALLTGG